MLGNEGSHSSKDAMQSHPKRVRSTNEIRCKIKPHCTSYMRTACYRFSFWPTQQVFSYELLNKEPLAGLHSSSTRSRCQTAMPTTPWWCAHPSANTVASFSSSFLVTSAPTDEVGSMLCAYDTVSTLPRSFSSTPML